jgi:hypothetical protein
LSAALHFLVPAFFNNASTVYFSGADNFGKFSHHWAKVLYSLVGCDRPIEPNAAKYPSVRANKILTFRAVIIHFFSIYFTISIYFAFLAAATAAMPD